MKKITNFFIFFVIFLFIVYFVVGFYIANSILRIQDLCNNSEVFPNSWNANLDLDNIKEEKRKLIRKNFNSKKYYLNKWENITFPSRESGININGWLFNYYQDEPIIIIVHGIFPNGKCKSEPNLIASLLIKNNINAMTIDLRNYGHSTKVSVYENLGLSEYLDVLGAFDYLKKIGFKSKNIGLLGISLGASTVIFAAANEPEITTIWSESSLAEFNMILKDEISRYGFPNIFGPSVSIAGQILSGVDPKNLNPTFALNKNKNYFFTHGEDDTRIFIKHFNFFKKYTDNNKINAEFWIIPHAGHVDGIFLHTEEYGKRMKTFFKKNL